MQISIIRGEKNFCRINYCFDNFPERKICSIFVPIYLLPLL
ncbi:hypothetical protein HMPREF2534_01994 [Bacteroides thetaiotaomicron]|nr:hypothetical protein HMPREF2534_01994 [Bacteroides thetaiotaomicron]